MRIYEGLTAWERGWKLKTVVDMTSDFNETLLWDDIGYLVAYYCRFVCYPIFYGFVISFCLRITDASYYKPNKWLK